MTATEIFDIPLEVPISYLLLKELSAGLMQIWILRGVKTASCLKIKTSIDSWGMVLDALSLSSLKTQVASQRDVSANEASDNETREYHAHDTELHTGTRTFDAGDVWRLCTRGEKVADFCSHRAAYQKKLNLEEGYKAILEATLREFPGTEMEVRELEQTKDILAILQKLFDSVGQLEQMVLDETQQDWDWKAGLSDQIEFRKGQNMLCKQFLAALSERGPEG